MDPPHIIPSVPKGEKGIARKQVAKRKKPNDTRSWEQAEKEAAAWNLPPWCHTHLSNNCPIMQELPFGIATTTSQFDPHSEYEVNARIQQLIDFRGTCKRCKGWGPVGMFCHQCKDFSNIYLKRYNETEIVDRLPGSHQWHLPEGPQGTVYWPLVKESNTFLVIGKTPLLRAAICNKCHLQPFDYTAIPTRCIIPNCDGHLWSTEPHSDYAEEASVRAGDFPHDEAYYQQVIRNVKWPFALTTYLSPFENQPQLVYGIDRPRVVNQKVWFDYPFQENLNNEFLLSNLRALLPPAFSRPIEQMPTDFAPKLGECERCQGWGPSGYFCRSCEEKPPQHSDHSHYKENRRLQMPALLPKAPLYWCAYGNRGPLVELGICQNSATALLEHSDTEAFKAFPHLGPVGRLCSFEHCGNYDLDGNILENCNMPTPPSWFQPQLSQRIFISFRKTQYLRSA